MNWVLILAVVQVILLVFVIKRLGQTKETIMSVISDWNAKVAPKLDRIQKGLDDLQALVEQLQNSPGAITAEDQALLDQIDAKVDAIAGDAEGVVTPPA